MAIRRPPRADTLIVSDVHLGSRVSQPKKLLDLLQSYRLGKHEWNFDRLILLGDIFDDLNFSRLKKHAWQVVGLIREITDEESNAEVVWILGNHDELLAQVMSHLVGVTVHEEYEWRVNGNRYLAMHGHQFDKWVMYYPNLSKIPSWMYDFIQRIDSRRQRLSRYIKEKSKKWLRINQDVARGIVSHARTKGHAYHSVFCGHTHLAEQIDFADAGLSYYNTGCWTGRHPPTYITIDDHGRVLLHEYQAERAEVPGHVLATDRASLVTS